MERFSWTRSDVPHCPKCEGKPISGQHRLKLVGRAGKLVHAKGGQTCQCGTCNAIYSYSDGFSTFLRYP